MSSIAEILKRKGKKEYWVLDGFAIEGGGVYKNYDYLITFTHLGSRCGYVAIKPEQSKIIDNLDVHGDITFSGNATHIISQTLVKNHCDDIWIGFDAAHGGDGFDFELVRKLWPNQPELYSYKKLLNDGEIIRTYKFMENECKKLIDQIIY